MRLFAALALPQRLVDELAAALPQPVAGVRPIPPRRWHLTLAFYGELGSIGAACLQRELGERLAAMPPAPPVSVRAVGGGVFHGTAAHVVLAGHDDANADRLAALALACRRAGRACRAPGASHRERFTPHVTVGRIRGRGAVDPVYRATLAAVVGGPWVCGDVQLVESFLGPDPRYELLARYAPPCH